MWRTLGFDQATDALLCVDVPDDCQMIYLTEWFPFSARQGSAKGRRYIVGNMDIVINRSRDCREFA